MGREDGSGPEATGLGRGGGEGEEMPASRYKKSSSTPPILLEEISYTLFWALSSFKV